MPSLKTPINAIALVGVDACLVVPFLMPAPFIREKGLAFCKTPCYNGRREQK
jgi:hypothetical protein